MENEIIRITGIKIKNLKNVRFGEIDFNPTKYGYGADLTGIYGQNGSGKTAVVSALKILKDLMTGEELAGDYADYITVGCDCAELEYRFSYCDADNEWRYKVAYKVSLARCASGVRVFDEVLSVGYNGDDVESAKRLAPIISTRKYDVFGPQVHYDCLVGKAPEAKEALAKTREGDKGRSFVFCQTLEALIRLNAVSAAGSRYALLENEDTSSDELFSREVRFIEGLPTIEQVLTGKVECLSPNNFLLRKIADADYKRAVKCYWALCDWAQDHFFVIGTDYLSAVEGDTIPFVVTNDTDLSVYHADGSKLLHGMYGLSTNGKTTMLGAEAVFVLGAINKLNPLFGVISPGLELGLTAVELHCDQDEAEADLRIEVAKEPLSKPELMTAKLGAFLINNWDKEVDVEIVSIKEGGYIPLRCESHGIKRIVAASDLLWLAFNRTDVTVVIDELDAGVFEHLLGEILNVISNLGAGQLIFTCHNQRPLETLTKECIVCSTTNPEKRFLRLKGIKTNHNRRDFYCSAILNGGQDEVLYQHCGKTKLIAALSCAKDWRG